MRRRTPPENYAWKFEENILLPIPMLLPLVPEDLVKLISYASINSCEVLGSLINAQGGELPPRYSESPPYF